MEGKKISLLITISGRVQGVGFRYYVYNVVKNYPCTGYVRNLHTGQVEVFLEGDSYIIDHILPLLKKGSHVSYVTEVDIEQKDYKGLYNNFDIKI